MKTFTFIANAQEGLMARRICKNKLDLRLRNLVNIYKLNFRDSKIAMNLMLNLVLMKAILKWNYKKHFSHNFKLVDVRSQRKRKK